MSTLEPAVTTADRRVLFNDPEFPFWTNNPQAGHVFLENGVVAVITKVALVHQNIPKQIDFRKLLPDGSDSLSTPTESLFLAPDKKLKVIDRMYYRGPEKRFEIDAIDYEPLILSSPKMNHANLLKDNPLSNLPYWGAPGGKNLTIVACLEWALVHLEYENRKLPCKENEITILDIKRAIRLQKLRQQTRQNQGVIGTNQPHISDEELIASASSV